MGYEIKNCVSVIKVLVIGTPLWPTLAPKNMFLEVPSLVTINL